MGYAPWLHALPTTLLRKHPVGLILETGSCSPAHTVRHPVLGCGSRATLHYSRWVGSPRTGSSFREQNLQSHICRALYLISASGPKKRWFETVASGRTLQYSNNGIRTAKKARFHGLCSPCSSLTVKDKRCWKVAVIYTTRCSEGKESWLAKESFLTTITKLVRRLGLSH